MSGSSIQGAEPTFSDEAVERARGALDHISIVNVRPMVMDVELVGVIRPAEDVSFEVQAAFSVGPGSFSNRFTYRIDLIDGEADPVATIGFVLQVDYVVDDREFELDPGAADFICATTGLFAAYPYARELAQSLTTRLQLDPLVLGLMPRGATRPNNITRVTRDEAGGAGHWIETPTHRARGEWSVVGGRHPLRGAGRRHVRSADGRAPSETA